jgi:integrase
VVYTVTQRGERIVICPVTVTLGSYYESTYCPERLVGCTPGTRIQYEVALKHWQRFSGATSIAEIDKTLLAGFAQKLLPDRSAATVNKTMRHLLAILRSAEEAEDIPKVPRFRKLRESKSVPLAFTVEEFGKLLATVARLPGTHCGVPLSLFWRSLLLVCWETGLRVKALLSVQSRDVLFDSGGLYCQASSQKNKTAQWFCLSDTTLDAIRAIYRPTRVPLWPREVTDATIARHFRKILDASGIYAPVGNGMCFHRLRRSTASYTKAAGGDPTKKLGHSAPSVTIRYFDPRIVEDQSQRNLMPLPRSG